MMTTGSTPRSPCVTPAWHPRLVARETSFVFTAVAHPVTDAAFSRHAGAARFAANQCLRAVKDALDYKERVPRALVPWSGFDLINYFNAWKRSEAAGCTWAVDSAGSATLFDTGLPWRGDVTAQVFEEAAVDLGRGLDVYAKSRRGERKGQRVGFPRFKKKGRCTDSFRIRNKLVKYPVTERDPATGKSRRKKALDQVTGKLVTLWKTDPQTGLVLGDFCETQDPQARGPVLCSGHSGVPHNPGFLTPLLKQTCRKPVEVGSGESDATQHGRDIAVERVGDDLGHRGSVFLQDAHERLAVAGFGGARRPDAGGVILNDLVERHAHQVQDQHRDEARPVTAAATGDDDSAGPSPSDA